MLSGFGKTRDQDAGFVSFIGTSNKNFTPRTSTILVKTLRAINEHNNNLIPTYNSIKTSHAKGKKGLIVILDEGMSCSRNEI